MCSTERTPYLTSTGLSGEAEGAGETTSPGGVERGRGRGRGFRGDRGGGRGRGEGGRGRDRDRGRGGPPRTSSIVRFFHLCYEFPLTCRDSSLKKTPRKAMKVIPNHPLQR